MKTIDTLAEDIYDVLRSKPRGDPDEEARQLESYGAEVALSLNKAMHERTEDRKPYVLYASELGKPCLRQLWFAHRVPQIGEAPQHHAKVKFLYGDLLESTVLTLAEAAGHNVELRQETKEWKQGDWTVRGRQDAVIDDVLVDVKSASTFSYRKFDAGLDDSNDSFGYRQQLSFYNGVDVPTYERQGFVAIDKQNGHIGFFGSPWINQEDGVKKRIAAIEGRCPPRPGNALEDASYGNKKLSTMCSYCPFKLACYENLETALYVTGPQFLPTAHVKKLPKAHVIHQSVKDEDREAIIIQDGEPYGS